MAVWKGPRKRVDGKYDYAEWSDEEHWIYPHGYCAGGRGGCDGKGHDTAEQAGDCFDEYCLEHEYRSWIDNETMRKCIVCSAFTCHRVNLGFDRVFIVCPQHGTKEKMRELLQSKGK